LVESFIFFNLAYPPMTDGIHAISAGTPARPTTPSTASSLTEDIGVLRQELLNLFCKFAYRTGDFVLSSGARSSYYINGKQVTLHPQGALAIAQLLVPLLPGDTQAVAGLTLGADPIVSAVSVISALKNRPQPGGIPALIVRKEAKGHGTQAFIEGPALLQASRVVVLEDVVTTGQSALKAVERLRSCGYTVNHIIALVDRQQGGAELYREAGLNFAAIFSIQEIQARARELEAG